MSQFSLILPFSTPTTPRLPKPQTKEQPSPHYNKSLHPTPPPTILHKPQLSISDTNIHITHPESKPQYQ